MGEIAEALRRANDARQAQRVEDAANKPTREPLPSATDSIYTELLQRGLEAPDREAATGSGVVSTRAAGHGDRKPDHLADEEPKEVHPLTQHSPQTHAPQGVVLDQGGVITDACLQLALRVRKLLADRGARSVVVVSALRGEGKTTVSCNLALALASLGRERRIALVDLDLRRPSLLSVLELGPAAVGVEDVILGKARRPDARISIEEPPLDVYPCLHGQSKAHELLLLPSFAEFVLELEDRYDIVVFDSPPTLLVPDAAIALEQAATYAVVARSGVTRARSFRKVLAALSDHQRLGAILDCGTPLVKGTYYERYEPDELED